MESLGLVEAIKIRSMTGRFSSYRRIYVFARSKQTWVNDTLKTFLTLRSIYIQKNPSSLAIT